MGLDPHTEEQTRLLADRDNAAILAVLDEAEAAVSVTELAERLLERDVDLVSTAEFERRLEQTCVALHHQQLPKLADANLVEYDPDANVARYSGPSTPDIDWADEATISAVADTMGGDEGEDTPVGRIRGRESVLRYGRRLADSAESELFCLYVSTDLLEDECVRRSRNAIDRGVTMYLGSRNPDVRDLARERLPEATVWEPQYDWLNETATSRVGRLVLADRRHVMLAVIDEPGTSHESPDETAIVGEGESHPLVVLVRDLLGPRLDHLDFQSSDFRSQLPT